MSKKFFDYFPPPRFLEMPYVGMNITPKAVRFIEIVKGKIGFEVGRFGERKFAAYNPAIPLKENRELVEALRSLRKEHNLTFVEAALPEEKAYVFKMEIPNKTEAEIRNKIEFHLEENVPLSLEEATFDYHIIEEPESKKIENDIQATISVLPSDVVNEYVNLLESVGLTPVSFLVESQAISKAVIKKGDRSSYLIVHITDTKTEFSVVSEESVQFTSALSIGADDFTAAIVKQFKITVEEARKMKREKGFIKDKENSDLFFALISTASALKDEIERIYIYWHTHTEKGQVVPRENIKKILLLGKDASLAGFKEYLSETIRAETDLANVWTNTFSFDDYIPPIEREDALKYGAAIGLALPKL